MTTSQWLSNAEMQLNNAGISTARLDALILLEFCSKRNRAYLLAYPDEQINTLMLSELHLLLKKRLLHIPISHIRGYSEFYGRIFVINDSVLEPRSETEAMIELLLEAINQPSFSLKLEKHSPRSFPSLKIADVGTGSGAIGITVHEELKNSYVELLEIDIDAYKVAKINVDLITPGLPLILSDLLLSATTKYDILLCNLPYVPEKHTVNAAASHEPKIAIYGGIDGLDVYRKLFKQLRIVGQKPLYIFTEALPSQHELLSSIAATAGYEFIQKANYIQLFALQA